MLTSYTSSEEENIPYLRKSAQIIRNIDEGPKLFDHARSKSASGYRPPFADLDPPPPPNQTFLLSIVCIILGH